MLVRQRMPRSNGALHLPRHQGIGGEGVFLKVVSRNQGPPVHAGGLSQKIRRRARNALSRRRPVSNWILQFQSLITVQWLCHHDMTASQTRNSTDANLSPVPILGYPERVWGNIVG